MLKEYTAAPNLRGIGVIIAIQCIGLIAAIISYAMLALYNLYANTEGHFNKEYPDLGRYMMNTIFVAQIIALLALIVTIATVGVRLMSL